MPPAVVVKLVEPSMSKKLPALVLEIYILHWPAVQACMRVAPESIADWSNLIDNVKIVPWKSKS